MSKSMLNKERESGIELVKLFSMFEIVMFHCIMSLECGPFISQGINTLNPTNNPTLFILQLLFYIGHIGNNIFLIASSWFLLNSNHIKSKKVINIILDVFILSIILLSIFVNMGVPVSIPHIIRSIFPTIFLNNWFITAYLLLYLLHPLFNIIIEKLSQRQLLAYNIIFFVLYNIVVFINQGVLFASQFIFSIGIYFFTAYLKIYMPKFINSRKNNNLFLFIGIAYLIVFQLLINGLGMHFRFFAIKIHYWATLNNPFVIIIAFTLFNKFRNLKIKNKAINYFSSLSLLVYIIHENFIFKIYVKHILMYNLWIKTGKINIVLFVVAFSSVLFIFSTFIAIVYNKVLQPIIHKFAEICLNIIFKIYTKIENKILKIN